MTDPGSTPGASTLAELGASIHVGIFDRGRLAVAFTIPRVQHVYLTVEDAGALVTAIVNAIPEKDRAKFFEAVKIA